MAQRGWSRLADALVPLVVVAALVEVRQTGLRAIGIPVGPSTPAVYRWLAENGDGGPLIEVPIGSTDLLRQSQAMYYSTAHWLPLANGYSPYVPKTWSDFMAAAAELPDAEALDRMLAVAPLRWVLVRRGMVAAQQWPRWLATLEAAGLRQAAAFPEATVFEVPPERRIEAKP
jgi:hypothetical protein